MLNWLKREKITPTICATSGDTVVVTYYGEERTETISTQINKTVTIDTLAIGLVEDELGFSEAIIGVFGKSADA